MPGIPGSPPRRYTHAQKVALVTEIGRRHRANGGSLRTIASELGTTDTSYLNWLKAGIAPVPAPEKIRRRVFPPADRRQLIREIDLLHGEGQTRAAACQAVGISLESLRRWTADEREPAMRPVEIMALVPVTSAPTPPPAAPLTLLAPGGYRLEGLDVETATALLKALA